MNVKILTMKKLFILSIFSLMFIFLSCSSDSEEEIIPVPDPDPPIDNNITYAANVKAIIDNTCVRCHNNPPINGAPMPLTTFQNVRDAVTGRGLINRVENGSMPPNGTDLTSAEIQVIKDWQAGGFKE